MSRIDILLRILRSWVDNQATVVTGKLNHNVVKCCGKTEYFNMFSGGFLFEAPAVSKLNVLNCRMVTVSAVVVSRIPNTPK